MAPLEAGYTVERGEAMNPQVSIGFGASSHATCADIVCLIRETIRETFMDFGPQTLLATLDHRAEIGESVARSLGLKIVLLPANILSGVRGVTSSSIRAADAVGTASVAEAAALASLGVAAHLLIPRRVGHLCTCAVAVLR
jgi:cobalt-precorrin 5A hydrolase